MLKVNITLCFVNGEIRYKADAGQWNWSYWYRGAIKAMLRYPDDYQVIFHRQRTFDK